MNSSGNSNSLSFLEAKGSSKRKCEYPAENTLSKQKKVTHNTPSLSKSQSAQLLPLPSNQIIKGKLSKTQIHDKSKNKAQPGSIKKEVIYQKFTEGCINKSLSDNLRKIIEEEKQLDSNLKKLQVMTEDTKLKIINEFVKKNLDMLELEGLMKQLEKFKIINEEKQKMSNDNIAKITAAKETFVINVEKSRGLIETMQSKKIQLESMIEMRNDEIKREEEQFNVLREREQKIESMKTNMIFDILKVEDDLKIIERRTKLLQSEFEKVMAQKEENNRGRIETISHLLILKPFYKKICVVRSKCQGGKNFTIHKNRKSLMVQDIDAQFKFDYIISCIDNPYEESSPSYINESVYITEELVNIFLPYLIQLNSINDERNLIVLFIAEVSQMYLSENINTIIQLLIGKISHYSEYSFQIKVLLKSEIGILTKESPFNESTQDLLKGSELNGMIECIEEEKVGYMYVIRNNKNNSKMTICHVSSDAQNVVNVLLAKFNEVNISKRKKDKSSKKKKTNKEVNHIINEITLSSCYYFLSICDVLSDQINDFSNGNSNFKDIFMNI